MALKIQKNMHALSNYFHMKWLINGTLLIDIVAGATHSNLLCVYDILEEKENII